MCGTVHRLVVMVGCLASPLCACSVVASSTVALERNSNSEPKLTWVQLLPLATVTLEWDPNPEANLAGYRVYYGTATRAYSASIEVPASATTLTVSNLDNNQRYFFAVTAFDADG